MIPTLTKQELKVFNYIRDNRGCTTRDIINDTYVTCVSGRITEIRKKYRLAGLPEPIISIGHRKYTGARPFEMYAIEQPESKKEAPASQLALV
jgi:hypothetical protein